MGCLQSFELSPTSGEIHHPHQPCQTQPHEETPPSSSKDTNIADKNNNKKNTKMVPAGIQITQSSTDNNKNDNSYKTYIMRQLVGSQSNSSLVTKQSQSQSSIMNNQQYNNIIHMDHIDEEPDDYLFDGINTGNNTPYLSTPTPLLLTSNISTNSINSSNGTFDDDSDAESTANINELSTTSRSTATGTPITYRVRTPSTPPPVIKISNDTNTKTKTKTHKKSKSKTKTLSTPKRIKPKNTTKKLKKRSISHDTSKSKKHKKNKKNKTKSLKRMKSSNDKDNIKNNKRISIKKKKKKKKHSRNRSNSMSIPQTIFSTQLTEYQNEQTNIYQYLSRVTHFDENTLRLLHVKFKNMIIDNNGDDDDQTCILDINAIAKSLGLPADCILVKRFFSYMDASDLGEVTFRSFARTMSMLSFNATMDEKCKLSFYLYDINNDNKIDKFELKYILTDLLKHNLFGDPLLVSLIKSSAKFLDKIIQSTMKLCDINNNGYISYSSYYLFATKYPHILTPYNININKILFDDANKKRMKRISLKSLKNKQLKQMVIGVDPKEKYNKRWKKPKIIKQIQKDQIDRVNSIHNPNDICKELIGLSNTSNKANKNRLNLIAEGNNQLQNKKEKEKHEKLEKEKREQQIQSTIDFLYD